MSVTPLLRSDCTVVLEVTGPIPEIPCAEVGDYIVKRPGRAATLCKRLDSDQFGAALASGHFTPASVSPLAHPRDQADPTVRRLSPHLPARGVPARPAS